MISLRKEASGTEGIRCELKLSAASCGESSILKKNKTFRLSSLTPQQAAGNALAGGFAVPGEAFMVVPLTDEARAINGGVVKYPSEFSGV
jgi:hypothetical protein